MRQDTGNLWIGLGVALLLLVPSSSRAQPEPSVAAMIAAWSARAEQVRSGQFVWKESMLIPEGGTIAPGFLKEATMATAATCEKTLLFDGEKLRYEIKGDQFALTGEAEPKDHVSAFDGVHSRARDAPGLDGVGFRGRIYQADQIRSNQTVRPILSAFGKARSPEKGPPPYDLLRAVGSVPLRDRQCLVAQWGRNMTIWADLERQYAVLRLDLSREDRVYLRYEIEYTEDPVCQWVPQRWKTLELKPDGTIRTATTSEVQSYQINPTLSDDQFRIEFPPSTLVSDAIADDWHLILPDGGKHILREDELFLSHAELLQAAGILKPRTLGFWLLVAAAVAATLLFALYAQRWLRQSRTIVRE